MPTYVHNKNNIMKKIFTLILSSFLLVSAFAQTAAITFNGANKNRNYQAVIDDISYYSNSMAATSSKVPGKKMILNLQPGSHSIEVYRYRNTGKFTNGTADAKTSGNAIYSNDFELREGYDMDISVEGNGKVIFAEKLMRNNRGNQVTVTPINDATFDALYQNVESKSTTIQKVTAERNAFNKANFYFTSDQVGELLLLIPNESYKLSLAKTAYPKVTDPNNFTSIYDVFTTTASRDAMNTFIRNNPNNNNRNSNNNNNNNSSNNNNNSQNKNAMADNQFNQLLQNVNGQMVQTGKYSIIKDAFSNTNNYFSTAQIRELLLTINSESDRLALAKLSYARVSNSAQFTSLYDLFYIQSNRDELNNFINGNYNTNTNANQPVTKTAMTDIQFNQLLQSVNSQYYQADRIVIVRNAINNTSNYFTAAQLRSLLFPITSESEKLALAIQAYLRITDAVNFGVVYDLFTTQANREELNNYVRANGGTGFNTNVRVAMSDAAFRQVLQKVSNHFLPWDKVRDAKEAFNNTSNFFSTYQIRQILSIITDENERLELAKLAHRTVTDPGNFLQLLDLFTNQSNKDELTNYVRNRSY